MTSRWTGAALALAAGVLAAQGAIAQTPPHQHGGAPQSARPAADSPATTGFKQADARMMGAMDLPYSGDPDVDFRRRMIPHHQGVIDMAKVGLAFAKDESTRMLAREIIAAQEREIAEMEAWLKAHGP